MGMCIAILIVPTELELPLVDPLLVDPLLAQPAAARQTAVRSVAALMAGRRVTPRAAAMRHARSTTLNLR
jgi:hypothetical protein